MNRIDRIKWATYLSLRILLVVAGAFAAYSRDWLNLSLAMITLTITFLPPMIERRFNVDYPSEFEIMILVFLFTSIFLGGMRQYYHKFWWWDIFLHTWSGIIIGFIGFTLVSILNREKRISIHLTPGFVALFSFCFALALGAIWEMFEFSVDTFFKLNMQKSGLVDTMTDLMVDAIGALIVCVLGYLYLKKDPKLFERIEKKLLK